MAIVQSRVAAVQAIYAAYYNRPADVGGLDFWTNQLDAANGNLTTIINAFGNSAEANALYTGSVENKINQVYLALFNRPAEVAGLNFYVAEINAQRISLAGAAQAIAAGAQGADKTAFDNKVAAATLFTTGLDTAAEVLAYSQNGAAEQGRAFLASVTATAPATQASADAAIAALDTGSTFTLTNGTDVARANVFNAGLVFTPGGDDRINALQDEDELTGSGTNATLNATLGNANDNGANIVTPELNDIQILNVGFTGSGGQAVTALDLQDAAGITSANITRVTQSIDRAELGNLVAPVATMSVSNTNANQAGSVEISFTAGALANADTGSLALSNVNLRNLNIGQNTSGINGLGVGAQGYETLTLANTGANTVGTFNLPMDTGTAGSLTITGTGSLTLGARQSVVNVTQNQLPEAQVWTANSGLQQAGGRISSIIASDFSGPLTLVLDNVLDIGKAQSSGLNQDVRVVGTAGDDTFVIMDAVQAAQAGVAGSVGDSISGGAGNDTAVLMNGANIANNVTAVERVRMEIDATTDSVAAPVTAAARADVTVTADFDFLPDATAIFLRNVSNDGRLNVDGVSGIATFNLVDLSAAQAQNITIEHSTTGDAAGASTTATLTTDRSNNGDITRNVINADLKADTATDTLGITIANAFNTGERFNFTVNNTTNAVTPTAAGINDFENLTITDSDTESNTVRLNSFATDFTGTVTLNGGVAGQFMNLDMLATSFDLGGRGIRSTATDGTAVDNFAGNNVGLGGAPSTQEEGFRDAGANATYQRLGSSVINSANYAGDVIVRVGTNAAVNTGGQTITLGAGNDTLVFDLIDQAQSTALSAGLTNADTANGGAGEDTLAIDGDGNVRVQKSEWDNLKSFETLYLSGNGGAAPATAGALTANNYILEFDNDYIVANGSGRLKVVNDDQSFVNNTAAAVNKTVGAGAAGAGTSTQVAIAANQDISTDNRSVVLFLDELNAQNHIDYDGEEGTGATLDRFVVNDNNTNGQNNIDGGEVNVSNNVDNATAGVTATAAASLDILEVRNSAQVNVSDLTGIRNVGVIQGQNDQAVTQTLTLILDDTTIDAMVDSGHASANLANRVETIRVLMGNTAGAAIVGDQARNAIDESGNALVPVSGAGLSFDGRGLTTKSSLIISADQAFATTDVFNVAVNGGAVVANQIDGAGGVDALNLFGSVAANVVNIDLAAGNSSFAVGTTTTTNRYVNIENVSLAGLTGASTSVALTGSAAANTLVGSGQADVITGGAGADQLTGGAGADSFAFAAGSSGGANGAAVADVISDFLAGTDKLQFTGAVDVVSGQQAAVQAGVTALAAGSTDAQIAEAMALANTTDLGVAFAVFNGSTYVLFEGTGAGNTYVQAEDVFIKLTGVTTAPTFAADVIA